MDRKTEAAVIQDQAIIFALLLAAVPAAVGPAHFSRPHHRGSVLNVAPLVRLNRGVAASALAAFALGLPAYILIKVFVFSVFSRAGDTATPVRAAAGALVVNLVFNLLLMGPLAHVGLALASSIAAWFNVGFLAWNLWKQQHLTFNRHLRHQAGFHRFGGIGYGGRVAFGADMGRTVYWRGRWSTYCGRDCPHQWRRCVFYGVLAYLFGLIDEWRLIRRGGSPP